MISDHDFAGPFVMDAAFCRGSGAEFVGSSWDISGIARRHVRRGEAESFVCRYMALLAGGTSRITSELRVAMFARDVTPQTISRHAFLLTETVTTERSSLKSQLCSTASTRSGLTCLQRTSASPEFHSISCDVCRLVRHPIANSKPVELPVCDSPMEAGCRCCVTLRAR